MKPSSFLKRFITGLAALAFAAATAMPALATDTPVDTQTTLTVALPSGISPEGLTANAYKVLDKVKPADAQGVDETAANSASSFYAVTADFAPFFSAAKTAYLGTDALRNANYLKLTYDPAAKQIQIAAATETETANPTGGVSIVIENAAGDKLDKTYFEASLISHILGDGDTGHGTAADAATLSDWLSRYIEAKPVSAALTAAFTGSSVTFTTTPGYFAVLITRSAGSAVINHTVLNVAGAADIQAKLGTLPLTKTVQNATNAAASLDGNKHHTTAAAGDALLYTVTSKIPDLTHYDFANTALYEATSAASGSVTGEAADKYHYFFTDTLTHQELVTAGDVPTLTLGTTAASFVAAAGGNDAYFTVSGKTVAVLRAGAYDAAAHTQTFKVVLDEKALRDAGLHNCDVTLTYHATAKSSITSDTNPNKVTLSYSYDPYTAAGGTLEDQTNVDTYDIEILKKFSDAGDTAKWTEITFQLRAGSESGAAVAFELGSNGYYCKSETGTGATDLKLNAVNGRLQLHGLGEGTYYLVETVAPAGYIKSDAFVIELKAKDTIDFALAAGSTTVTLEGAAVTFTNLTDQLANPANEPDHGITFDILNRKGFLLPTTGGDGMLLVTVCGILLFTAGALVLRLAFKKKD